MAPQSFDQIQARAVGGQPVDRDLVAVRLQPCLHSLRVVKAAVIGKPG